MTNNINDNQTKTPYNNFNGTFNIGGVGCSNTHYYQSITRRDVLTKLKDLYQYEDIESVRKGILDLMVEIGSSNTFLSDLSITYRDSTTPIDAFPSTPC